MEFVIQKKWKRISPTHLQQALIEFYSKRNPDMGISSSRIENKECLLEEERIFIEKKQEKKDFKDASTQTFHNKDQYKYVFEIKDKRKRRSVAWKLYKSLCYDLRIEPILRYPHGDDRDYIKEVVDLHKRNEQ